MNLISNAISGLLLKFEEINTYRQESVRVFLKGRLKKWVYYE